MYSGLLFSQCVFLFWICKNISSYYPFYFLVNLSNYSPSSHGFFFIFLFHLSPPLSLFQIIINICYICSNITKFPFRCLLSVNHAFLFFFPISDGFFLALRFLPLIGLYNNSSFSHASFFFIFSSNFRISSLMSLAPTSHHPHSATMLSCENTTSLHSSVCVFLCYILYIPPVNMIQSSHNLRSVIWN